MLAAAALSLAPGTPAQAASYPDRPLRLVVPYPPGATNDLLGRVLAEPLARDLGQPVLVDNRGGAATIIGATAVARAAPDGYTMLLGTGTTYTLNPLLRRNLSYDTGRDFTMIAIIAEVPIVFIGNPALPVTSLAQLVNYAKANPDRLNFASSGLGSSLHLAGELFARRAGINMTHVSFPGSGPAMHALLSNQVQIFSEVISGALPQIAQKAVVPFAVTSPTRLPVAPEIPTVAESGFPGFDALGWYALAVPKATPAEVVDRLRVSVNKILASGVLQERFGSLGIMIPGPWESDAAERYMARDRATWEPLIRSLNLALE
jgi:tripartite-type tricarboxylate transporter receptor subunit TctC